MGELLLKDSQTMEISRSVVSRMSGKAEVRSYGNLLASHTCLITSSSAPSPTSISTTSIRIAQNRGIRAEYSGREQSSRLRRLSTKLSC
jgi:hypothetical protein